MTKCGLRSWCKECNSEYNKRYNGTRAEYQKIYHKEHRERRRELSKERRQKLKIVVLTHYGSRLDYPSCVGCEESRLNCLTIDHIHGGGREHLTKIGGHVYDWLKQHSYPTGYQTLCMNCQFIKKFEENEVRK